MRISLEDGEDDVFDTCSSIASHVQDHKKGVFLPGLKITAKIIEVDRAPRTHPFNPNL